VQPKHRISVHLCPEGFDLTATPLPAMAEPFFLAFNAKVEISPAMTLEDLKNAGPGIENAVKKYSRAARAASA
jgi:hypothetical protein